MSAFDGVVNPELPFYYQSPAKTHRALSSHITLIKCGKCGEKVNLGCNNWITMLFNKEIEGLLDDGFEGSTEEHRIFTEVFLGNDSGITSKRGLNSGVIKFESDCGCSTMTSHTGPAYFSEGFSLSVKRDDDDVNVKRMKLSSNNVPNGKSNMVMFQNSLSSLNEVVSNDQNLRCSLVESSTQGIISSSYLLKRHVETDGIDDSDVSSCSRPSSLDGSKMNEVIGTEIIVAPFSEESYESKLLVVDPSVTAANMAGSLRFSKPKWKETSFVKLEIDELSLTEESLKDPRSVLRYHINHLLRSAGWDIGRRKRSNKFHGLGEFVYRSPQGRPIREFRRAWDLCGQSLFVDANSLVQVTDGKQWTDLSQFWSELWDTVGEIEELLKKSVTMVALAHCWCLLDPFAHVVFIDKTVATLKSGREVRTRKCLAVDSSSEHDTALSSLCDVPIHPGNTILMLEAPRTVSPHQDSNRKMSLELIRDVYVSSSEEEEDEKSKKADKKSKNINEMKANLLHQNRGIGLSTCHEDGLHDLDEKKIEIESRSSKKKVFKTKKLCYDGSSSKKFVQVTCDGVPVDIRSDNKLIELEKGLENGEKRSISCQIEDDDLLISAVLKGKSFRSNTRQKRVSGHSKARRKHKSQKGGCRLLPRSLNKGGKHLMEGKWSAYAARTVLSWLIHSGVISLNEVIQYRNLKDDSLVKDGLITKDGILCRCCGKVLSISEFKIHSGYRSNRPCLNLFLESGKPFTLCQLEAWSAEYKARKSVNPTVKYEESDQNDDSCGLCGDGGELICCDNCPSTFHQECLYTEELPAGSWYCQHCTCRICGDLVNELEASNSTGALKCAQCEQKYHEACRRGEVINEGGPSDTWFCGQSCQEIYLGLRSRIGFMNTVSDGLSWTLVRCIHGDQKVHSAHRLVALKAECNSKLAVALTIMEECFLPMLDNRSGIDMIPHLVYNWGSELPRLNYHGFYNVVLEKDDVLMSVASVRIHGVTVAEMPLIATCSKYRRRGMCRLLMNSIEETLKSFKVEKLVISAIPDLVETWTIGFGFQRLEDNERQSLSKINLMVFPGTVWLKKPLL